MRKNLETATYAATIGVAEGLEVDVAVWDPKATGYINNYTITKDSQISMIEACCELYEADVWEISFHVNVIDITLVSGGFETMFEGL